MPYQKSIRSWAVALALLALMLLAATLGGLLHHHPSSTPENICQICHLNHQPIERPLASDRVFVLAPA
ncbi:MAG: hypothetical protein ABSA57_05445 [Candidatus Acidiferrales bacterium]|jgi:hypothetical protein